MALVLTRKIGESIMIGDDIEITIESIKGREVRIGIIGNRETTVLRKELYEQAKLEKAIRDCFIVQERPQRLYIRRKNVN